MKICGGCKETKELVEFGKNAARNDGVQSACRSCRKIHNTKYYRNTPERNVQRQAWLANRREALRNYMWYYLKTHFCVDCGETDPIVLEFGHLFDKEFCVGQMLNDGRSLEKLKLEIKKCEVRCANCHRKMTAKRGNHWRYVESIK